MDSTKLVPGKVQKLLWEAVFTISCLKKSYKIQKGMQCDFLPETENRNTEKQNQIMSKNIMHIFQPAKVNPFSGPIDNFA